MDFSSQDGGPVSKKKDRHLNKKQRSSWATKIASRQLRAGPGPFTSPRPWRSNQFVRLYAQSCRDSRYWGNCSSALSRMTCFFGGFSLYHICQTYIHCGRIETMPFGNGRSIEYVEPHESHTLFFIQNIFMKEKERERERPPTWSASHSMFVRTYLPESNTSNVILPILVNPLLCRHNWNQSKNKTISRTYRLPRARPFRTVFLHD